MIPLSKLISLTNNKYIFSRAAMMAVDRIGNLEGYPESKGSWKIVPSILKMMLDEDIQYNLNAEVSENAAEESDNAAEESDSVSKDEKEK